MNVSDEEKRKKIMQIPRPAWNGFVDDLGSCATFAATLQKSHPEAVRREQHKGRRSTCADTAVAKIAAALHNKKNTERNLFSRRRIATCPRSIATTAIV